MLALVPESRSSSAMRGTEPMVARMGPDPPLRFFALKENILYHLLR